MADDDKKTLLQRFEDQMRNATVSVQKALQWFRDHARELKALNANNLLTRDSKRLRNSSSLKGTKYIGRMIMFFYQPKYRETLPYYDMFPLVIVVATYPDGFLGLNLHYLPIMYRLKLLNALYTIYKNEQYDENKKLQLSYEILNKSSKFKYFKPCLKRYLFKGNDQRGGGVTSSFYIVDPLEWEKMLALPVERFMKKSAATVQAESLAKVARR